MTQTFSITGSEQNNAKMIRLLKLIKWKLNSPVVLLQLLVYSLDTQPPFLNLQNWLSHPRRTRRFRQPKPRLQAFRVFASILVNSLFLH